MGDAGASTAEGIEYVDPDNEFIREVIRLGGRSTKKCFQCGTCTATCSVSYAKNTDESFPRKLMLWTQWGLKERILRDPGIWACHQCHDCSANCPRGAKPGDVLAALRALSIERASVPGFMARAYREPKYLPLLFGIPAIAVVVLIYLFFGFTFPTGEVIYSHYIPDRYIEVVGAIVFGLALMACGVGLLRFWRALESATARPVVAGGAGDLVGEIPARRTPATGITASFIAALSDTVKHTDFRSCGTDRSRTIGHMAVLYGAPFLLFATALAALYSFTGAEAARPLTDPAKLTGNLGALLLLAGVTLLTIARLRTRSDSWGAATYFDWLFLWVIYLDILTGLLVEVARFTEVASVAYPIYILHLATVFATFVYAPYGKFAHSFYRLAALTFIRHGGKAGPHRLYVLFPAALAVGVGAVAVLVGLGMAVLWLAQALPGTLGDLHVQGTQSLNMYLPVANVSANLPCLVGIGFGVGVLSGMTGVGGGFLMTPLLMTVGIPASIAVGSDNAQIVGTGTSGALAHWRLGNVDLKLGLFMLIGSIIGGTIGVQLVAALRTVGNFDFWVRVLYVLVLGTVGAFMLREGAETWIRSARLRMIKTLVDEGFEELRSKLEVGQVKTATPLGSIPANWPLQVDFGKARVRVSAMLPFGLGLTVGMLAALMGVGGGFILVPVMIYVLGVPTHIAVGTGLFQMVIASGVVAFQQAITNHNVDVMLAIALMIGGAIGGQVGARVGHQLEGHQLRTFLGTVVVIVMLKMLSDIILPPGSLIGIASGGGH